MTQPTPTKLTLEVLEKMSQIHDVLIPAWDTNKNDLIVPIKRVNIRDIAGKVNKANPKIMKDIDTFEKKYSKFDDITVAELTAKNGHPAFILHEDMNKINPYIVEIFHQAMTTPKYQDLLDRGVDFDFFQKQILLIYIMQISSREVAEMIAKENVL
jgi:hypothetical protein